MFKYRICFFVGILFSLLLDLIVEPTRIRWRKDANYDCSNCKVWDCPVHRCRKKRGKLENID